MENSDGILRKATRSAEDKARANAGTRLQNTLRRNWQAGDVGVYAVCSAHAAVVSTAIQQSINNGSVLHVESTSSQVNQFGGYTGQTPRQFADFIHSAAESAGLSADRVLLGGDHLGPFPWRNEPYASALQRGCELVRSCVLAGYQKIHLDPSMPCADDPQALEETTIAERAVLLCAAAEKAFRELPSGSSEPVYVIGTEVPAPGGEVVASHSLAVTKAADVHRTLDIFHKAFMAKGLFSAWERVVALVVQPGVDLGSDTVFDYHPGNAAELSSALSAHPGIVYEAHSTDYQAPSALTQMVKDHFAILKVGPWLTFAYREAVLALSEIEHELLGTNAGCRLSNVRGALEEAMLRNPSHWRSYYHGDEAAIRRELIYSYSDRCRYYWHEVDVQGEINRLHDNLAQVPIPATLVSQYLPEEYKAMRAGEIQPASHQLVQEHIRRVLCIYAAACNQVAPTQPA